MIATPREGATFEVPDDARNVRSVLVAGYWGFGNVGDEAVLSTVIDDLRTISPDIRIILTSERPDRTRKLHGCETIGWRHMAPLVEAVSAVDHVVVGGGGLWSSYLDYRAPELLRDTSNYSEHIFSVPILARLLSKPVTLYGIGGGVIVGSEPMALARLSAACAAVKIVRDTETKAFFQELGALSSSLHVAADLAFRLRAADEADIVETTDIVGWAEKHRPLAVTALKWFGTDQRELAASYASVLKNASKSSGRPILLLPFYAGAQEESGIVGDATLIDDIVALLPGDVEHRVLSGEHHPKVISRILSHASAVLSMRLHGCILSVRNAVPVIGVAYDPKIRSVMSDIGLGDFVIDIAELDAPRTADRLAGLASDPAARATFEKARQQATASSGRAPEWLAQALARPVLPPLPERLAALQAGFAVDFLRVRSAIDRHPLAVASAVRAEVNGGRSESADALASMLAVLDPAAGEWPYLQAVAAAALKEPSTVVMKRLDDAERLGFDPAWIAFVRGCQYVNAGNIEAAQIQLDRIPDDHASKANLAALVDAAVAPPGDGLG